MGMPRRNFLGLKMAQSKFAVPVLDDFLITIKNLGQIIEFGTYAGGFSVFIHLACKARGSKFVTYDVKEEYLEQQELFNQLHIDYRLQSVFNVELDIKDLIQGPGTTVLICDNGNKVREFNTFAKYLKVGDFIMAHDYSPDREYFKNEMRGIWWSSNEIIYEQIQQTVTDEGLVPYMADEWQKAAWGCFRKK